MEYLLSLEKNSNECLKERKLSHPHTPQPTIQQFDITYEKEIQSLLENANLKNKTKIIGVRLNINRYVEASHVVNQKLQNIFIVI